MIHDTKVSARNLRYSKLVMQLKNDSWPRPSSLEKQKSTRIAVKNRVFPGAGLLTNQTPSFQGTRSHLSFIRATIRAPPVLVATPCILTASIMVEKANYNSIGVPMHQELAPQLPRLARLETGKLETKSSHIR
jgi:hypothetical protein